MVMLNLVFSILRIELVIEVVEVKWGSSNI